MANDSQTDELVRRAAAGDDLAVEALLHSHRDRLKRMVRLRLNPQLQRRVDESDIVQDALWEAARRMPEYLVEQPLPFFLWLRRIAGQKLVDVHRRHLGATRRDVRQEISLQAGAIPAASSVSLAAQLLGRLTSPSSAAIKAETRLRVQEALNGMDAIDREVLALRHFERLSNSEAAQVLDVSESACSNRYVRALARLKQALKQIPGFL